MTQLAVSNLQDLLSRRAEILRLAHKHGAVNVRIFGSFSRDGATQASDIDVLVDLGDSTSPWFPLGLKHDLESLLLRDVDVVTEGALPAEFKPQVLAEAVAL